MKKLTKADRIIQEAGHLLERYNWHTITGLPYDIFNDIKPFIKKGKKLKVAKIIAKIFNFFK